MGLYVLHLVVCEDWIILPQHHMTGSAGAVHINDALIAGAAEPQADVVLVLHEVAVHEHIYILKELVGHLAASAAGPQNFLLKMVAGIAPDGLAGVQRLDVFDEGQQFPLVFRLERLAAQQRQAVDVARSQAF